MIWILGAALAAIVIGGVIVWRIRRRRRHRLIAFVGLLREPVEFDPAVLATIAGRVWNVDLGDGHSEGADGFVVGVGPMNTIMLRDRMFLINCIPRPYSENIEQEAEAVADKRSRAALLEHRAWFSCDAMGVDGSTSEADIVDWYRRLGKLFAELLDDNCLLIFVPDLSLGFPINDETRLALRSKDPLATLNRTLTTPIIEVAQDDPLMKQAVAKARETWPQFAAAFEANAGENFAVKAPVSHSGNTEFIWICVTSFEGELIFGELGNEPGDLGPLKLGSKVSVPRGDLNDWCYIDNAGKMIGGYTIAAIENASRQRRGK